MIDIGFSGIRERNRTSADQPVARTIGISGVSARRALRSASSSTSATASRPASSVTTPPQRRGQAVVGLGGEHRQAGEPRASRRGGGSSSRCMTLSTSSWRSSGISRRPNDSVAVRRSGEMTVCEKYGGTASSRPSIRLREDSDSSVVKRSGSENAGQISALPQPFFSV